MKEIEKQFESQSHKTKISFCFYLNQSRCWKSAFLGRKHFKDCFFNVCCGFCCLGNDKAIHVGNITHLIAVTITEWDKVWTFLFWSYLKDALESTTSLNVSHAFLLWNLSQHKHMSISHQDKAVTEQKLEN